MAGRGPLEGITVVEFGSFIAGPFAGQLLADMGADVIKIEPLTGDPWRHQNPFAPGESRVFLPLNRGVRSVSVDLKSAGGQDVLTRIIAAADAVVSNNRPDTAEALGIDYDSLAPLNPGLVYVEITAYGPKGPRAGMPGFDLIMQGFAGAIASEGKLTGGHPEPVWSSSYIDFSTAYAATAAVMAGIIERHRTGKGQRATTSLFANALAMQCMRLTRINEHPTPVQKWYDDEYPRLQADGTAYPDLQERYQQMVRPLEYRCYYRAYRTKDGGLALGTLAFPARRRLLEFLGMQDPRVQDPGADSSSPELQELGRRLITEIENVFSTRTTAEWFKELRERDIPCEPVRFIEELVDDEQALANSYVIEVAHPAGVTYRTSGPVVRFDGGMPEIKPSPLLGQHTGEVLKSAGYSDADVAELAAAGCIRLAAGSPG
jgi:crotonobetainyl-CoA:carnitine CoA-transferase CaiB-like acyl-CoA transferase